MEGHHEEISGARVNGYSEGEARSQARNLQRAACKNPVAGRCGARLGSREPNLLAGESANAVDAKIGLLSGCADCRRSKRRAGWRAA